MPLAIEGQFYKRPRGRRPLPGLLASLAVLSSGLVAAQAHAAETEQKRDAAAGSLISWERRMPPDAIKADERLLVHYMPGVAGHKVQASTLLFVPRGRAPAGGWKIVAWIHGTATWADKSRAPSLSPDLDGGLTRDGFRTGYVPLIASLVDAGYAVVAPDLEGLGPVASGPHPYYNAASSALSVIAGVGAARQAEPALSLRWAVVGHSDGGRGALAVEAYASRAPGMALAGTVAVAPFLSIDASVRRFGEQASKDPANADGLVALQNFYVAGMATGLMAEDPSYDPALVMGGDLRRLLPVIQAAGSPGAIETVTKAVAERTRTEFRGFKPGWSATPAMTGFLVANDFAATPGFTMRLPTLIVQGNEDGFVPEPLTTAFAAKLVASGAPVTYRTYPGADHLNVLATATDDVLRFLAELLR